MEISGVKEAEVMVFNLKGRLDAQTAPEAEKEVKAWLAAGENKLVGDLTGLEYISSAGLRLMLMAAKSLKASGGKICLFGLQAPVREVFDMAGFSSIIPLVDSKEEAFGTVGG